MHNVRAQRMVYDELGSRHFEHGLALIKQDPTVDSAGRLRAKFERSQHRQIERNYQGRLNSCGSIAVHGAINDFLEPDDPDTPFLERSPPYLSSVAVNQDISLQLDTRNTLMLGANLLTKSGLGVSTLRIGFKRRVSHHSSVQLSSALDQGPFSLGFHASRLISGHCNASAGAIVSLGSGLLGFNMHVSRELSPRTLGMVTWQMADVFDEGCLRLRLDRNLSARQEDGVEKLPRGDRTGCSASHTAGASANNTVEIKGTPSRLSAQHQVPGVEAATMCRPVEASLQAPVDIAAYDSGGVQRGMLRASALLHSQLRMLVEMHRPWIFARFESSSLELTLHPSGTRYKGSVQWKHPEQASSKISIRVRFVD